jgi:hypothetical protein
MKIYPDDWRNRLTTGLVSAACVVAAMLIAPRVGFSGFWPFILSVTAAVIVGNFLGLLLCRQLFPAAKMEKKE